MMGLIKALFHLLGYVFAAVVTYYYYPSVKQMLIDLTTMDENLKNFVTTRLEELGANAATSAVTTTDIQALNQLPIPENMMTQLVEFMQTTATDTALSIADVTTDVVMSMISIFSLFILVLLVVKIIAGMLDLISKLPVLKSINAFGGALFGAVKGYVILSITFVLGISILSLKSYEVVQTLVDTSTLSAYFIDYNLLLMWFSQLALN